MFIFVTSPPNQEFARIQFDLGEIRTDDRLCLIKILQEFNLILER